SLRGYALGYRPDGTTNWKSLPARGTPAGGAYASAPDLLAFHRALVNGVLLRPETLRKLVLQPPAAGKSALPITSTVFAGDAVVLDEVRCRGRRVDNRIDAHRDESDVTRLVTQAIPRAADRLRRQRTDIDAARVEEGEENDLPAQPRERDRLAGGPIGEREIGGDRAGQRFADELRRRARARNRARDQRQGEPRP